MEQENQKRLIPIKVSYSEEDNLWSFTPSGMGMHKFVTNRDESSIRKLLRRVKAKDSQIYPNKRKLTTYKTMLDDVKGKGESTIYVWKSYWPVSSSVVDEMLK